MYGNDRIANKRTYFEKQTLNYYLTIFVGLMFLAFKLVSRLSYYNVYMTLLLDLSNLIPSNSCFCFIVIIKNN